MTLTEQYYRRLQLDPQTLDSTATLAKLRILQEVHLSRIPFENMAQHGAVGGPVILDTDSIQDKILERKRGGFCFELNGLFAAFLDELGYRVNRVLACVYAGDGYRENPTHMLLIVTCVDDSVHFVDVGFAEPPLQPLEYSEKSLEKEQVTVEGMKSRFIKLSDDHVELQWYVKGNWSPRLRWSWKDSQKRHHESLTLADFAPGLNEVQSDKSIFSMKLIVCKLTRSHKISMAGNKLKITGSPRFPVKGEDEIPVSVEFVESATDAQRILQETFGVPLGATEGLDLSKSLAAHPEVWGHV